MVRMNGLDSQMPDPSELHGASYDNAALSLLTRMQARPIGIPSIAVAVLCIDA